MTSGEANINPHEEIRKSYFKLRVIENNAYASVLAAFRAQGEITWEKQRILSILQRLLDVSNERHSAEMIRVESDPLISSIARDAVHERRLDVRALVERNDFEQRLLRMKTLYTVAPTDTDSESEDYKKPKKRGGRKPKKQTPQKRDFDDAFPPAPVATPPASRAGRKSKKQKLSTPVSETTPRHPVLDLIDDLKNEERDFDSVNDVETLESIAQIEYSHIETLEAKFNELKDDRILGHPLGLAVQNKRDRIIRLVEKLEPLEKMREDSQ